MTNTPWHIDADLMAAYANGTTGPVLTASTEAHLMRCEQCRAMATVGRDRQKRVWAEIIERVEAPPRRPLERLLARAGLDDSTALLVAATPALSGAWFSAVTLVLSLTLFTAYVTPNGIVLFLAMAPVLPMLGVALAYSEVGNPTSEVAEAAPYSQTRLMFLRSSLVAGAAMGPSFVLGAFAPGPALLVVAWLLPALALTMLTFVLCQFIRPEAAGFAVAAAWFALVLPGFLPTGDPLLTLSPAVQGSCAALFTLSAAVLGTRRRLSTERF
jgi:hypothetical protein